MKMYNFKKFAGSKRIWRGILFTLPTAIITAIGIGVAQHFISIQLSLSYLLLAYIIAKMFRKYGRSVSIHASYVATAIFILSVILVDLFTIIGLNFPTFTLIRLFTPIIFISKLNITSIPSIINLLIIAYSINIIFNNSRIV